ncbi:DNA ligase 3 [Toxocara canis]|uniref:DNA ligase 3 n=1 Tax=Toxocara canis TaxID=6265 RepID=A0A0B2VJR4_TOXCA|nr:DNA ligase 3 [Toxocara canis]
MQNGNGHNCTTERTHVGYFLPPFFSPLPLQNIFGWPPEALTDSFNQTGDVSITIRHYFEKSVEDGRKSSLSLQDGLRMARMVPNPFTTDSSNPSDMKQYFHADCLFDTLSRCRASTKVIESPADIDGFDGIQKEDQGKLLELISDLEKLRKAKTVYAKVTPRSKAVPQSQQDIGKRKAEKQR